MTEPTQEVINIGTVANDGTGDTIRVAFRKTNNNFAELYSTTSNATANLVTLESALEGYVGDLTTLGGAAFDSANAAFGLANDLIQISQTAIRFANDAVNTSIGAAINAKAAFDYANSTYNMAITARNHANASFTVVNTAFLLANNTNANVVALTSKVGYAYRVANSAYDYANDMYEYFSGIAVNAKAAFDRTNSCYLFVNTSVALLNFKLNSAFLVANAGYGTANQAYRVANSAYVVANAAFDTANLALSRALNALPNVDNAVFNGHLYTANTLIGGTLALSSNGVQAFSNNWYGLYAKSSNNHSIRAESVGGKDAIITLAQSGNGIYGTANTGNGVVGFSDTGYGGYFYSANGVPMGSGYLKQADDGTLQIVDALTVKKDGMLQFDSGYGYTANAYGVRAWVNFDGTSTASNLSNLDFVADGRNNTIRVYINDPANNDIVVDSTVQLLGVGNGSLTHHPTNIVITIACWLGVGCRRTDISRAYKVKTVNQAGGYFECDYPDRIYYYGYWFWFPWWWWWYFRFGWYVTSEHSMSGKCSILRSKVRGSGGVSSVNDLGNGKYQINFDFELPDTNYAVVGTASNPEYFQYDWRVGCTLGVRTQHTTFCEVSANHHWGGQTYWYWWWWYYVPWNGPGTYPAKQMHIAIVR